MSFRVGIAGVGEISPGVEDIAELCNRPHCPVQTVRADAAPVGRASCELRDELDVRVVACRRKGTANVEVSVNELDRPYTRIIRPLRLRSTGKIKPVADLRNVRSTAFGDIIRAEPGKPPAKIQVGAIPPERIDITRARTGDDEDWGAPGATGALQNPHGRPR